MNAKLSGFTIIVKSIIYLLLYNLNECTFLKSGSCHLFTAKQKSWLNKVNNNCHIELMHLLKILVSRLAKYRYLNVYLMIPI